LLAVPALLALAAFASACSSNAAPSGGAAGHIDTSGEITIGTPNPPLGFNPATSPNPGQGYPEYEAVFGQLIAVNPTTGDFEPDLATSWSWSPNHLALYLNLRHGVRFQDGTPFNADAVAYYEDYYIRQGDFASVLSAVTSVRAIGNYEVVFNLSHEDSTLLGDLTIDPGFVPSEAALKSEGSSFASHPIGAGPYRFVSQEPGYDYVFQRWDGYWNNGSEPRVQTLRWEVFPTDTAEVAAIESGTINVAAFLDPEDYKALKADANLVGSTAPNVDAWFGFEDTNDPPFNSTKFRLGWEEAIDRQALANVVTDGTGQPFTVSSPGVEPYVQSLLPIWPYDPASARALIKAAGYPHGLNVTCYAEIESMGGNYNAVDPVLVADYKAVGITLTIRPLTPTDLGLMLEGKLGGCAFYSSDAVDTSIWGLENTYENTSWSQGGLDPARADYGTDKCVDQFQRTFTNAGLEELFYDIEKSHKTEPGALTPLFTAPEINFYQSDIRGWYSNAFNDDHWYAMYRVS
jgi:peptide/nickel transport system substrate-binding protein